MAKILNYLNELNIDNIDKLKDYINKNSIDSLFTFLNFSRNLVSEDWKKPIYTPFSFVPSFEISGIGGCDDLECKTNRALNFAKFAALYSDNVFIYLHTLSIPHEIEINDGAEEFIKNKVISEFSLILIYSELIDNEIIRIVPSDFNLCSHCFEKVFMKTSEIERLNELVEYYSSKAKFYAENYFDSSQVGFIRIENVPELFPDHNGYLMITHDPFLEEIKHFKRFPHIIKNKELINRYIDSRIKEEYLEIKFESYMSAHYNAKYITNKNSSFDMVNCLNGNIENVVQRTPLFPIYNMPIIENADIKTILNVRTHEKYAFDQYRVALNKAIKEHYQGQSSIEIKEVYDDIVYPAFLNLDKTLKTIKKKKYMHIAKEIIIIGSTVTLGILGGIVPPTPAGIFTAIGGSTLLSKEVEELFGSKEDASKNDYYFLWKLKSKI